MQKIHKSSTVKLLIASFVLGIAVVAFNSPLVHALQTTVNLGTATPFAILAGTPIISDLPTSSVTGDVGLSPATGAGIGLLCTQVTGTIYSVDAAGPLPCRVTNPGLLTTAKNDLTTAWVDAAGRTPSTTVGTELGGTTVTTGIYDSGATDFQITAGAGPLVIDAQGDPYAVFIFKAPASAADGLIIGPGSVVSLVNGAQACNVFWQVDSAAIDTTAVFKGTILALNSITVANGANIEGRLLARNGLVSLINDTITVPTCVTPPTSGGTGNSNTTPTLPNTGSAQQQSTSLWITAALVSIGAITLLATYLKLRNKRLN